MNLISMCAVQRLFHNSEKVKHSRMALSNALAHATSDDAWPSIQGIFPWLTYQGDRNKVISSVRGAGAKSGLECEAHQSGFKV